MVAMTPSLASAVSRPDDGSWRGCKTLPDLFHSAMTDWPNNSFLGLRYKRADGSPGPCYEWESYREVELSITAIARSLRCTLGDSAGPGLTAIILGRLSPESGKIHQALCHISATPVFVTTEVTHQQLQLLIQSLEATVVFLHQDHQPLLEAAVTTTGYEPGVHGTSAATAGEAGAQAIREQLQLVVVWGAGGIKYTQPSAELISAFGGGAEAGDLAPEGDANADPLPAEAAGGVSLGARVVGFEDFKRSHFNQVENPSAAFAEMILPQPTDVAAVVVTAADCAAAAVVKAREDTAGPDTHPVLPEAAAAEGLSKAGLSMTVLKHDELVAKAAKLLREKLPALESSLAPYDPEHAEEYTGRPQFPTRLCTGKADIQQLVKIAAATAAAGRIGFSEFPDVVVAGAASDASALKANF